MATIRLALIIAAAVAGMTVLYLIVDAIGDRREEIVRAELQPKIDRAEFEREQWKSAHNKLLADAERLDAENKEKLKDALAAKAAAERAYGAADEPQPGRVRQPAKRAPAKSTDSGGGSWLLSVQALLGGQGQAGKK